MRYTVDTMGENGLRTYLGLCSFVLIGLFLSSNTTAYAQPSEAAAKAAKTLKSERLEAEADDDELTVSPPALEEEQVTLDPMEMRFRVNKIERGLGRDSRRFDAKRVVTLTTLGAVGELSEKVWRGKTLAVFHKVPIDIGNGLVSYNRVKVGEVKIKAVSQSVLLGEITSDDLMRSFDRRRPRLKTGEARVVMLGDTARLERRIVARKKKRKRRVYKPKKKSRYERKEMRWKL